VKGEKTTRQFRTKAREEAERKKSYDKRLTQFRINLLRLPRHSLKHRVRTKSVEVCSGVVERALRSDDGEIESRIEFELPSESFEDLALGFVGVADAEVEHSVEPGGT